MVKKLGLTALAGLCIGVVACETSDEDKLGSAQNCLDKATKTTVSDCINIVASISGERAQRVRCGGNFIMGGLDSTAFKNAFSNLKTGGSGGTGTSAMITYLVLKDPVSGSASTTIAAAANAACKESGLSSMKTFGGLAVIATQVSAAAGGNVNDPAAMKTALENFTGSDEELGAAAKTIAAGNCATTPPPDYCSQVNTATTSCTSDADIGECVRLKMANQTTGLPACCS